MFKLGADTGSLDEASGSNLISSPPPTMFLPHLQSNYFPHFFCNASPARCRRRSSLFALVSLKSPTGKGREQRSLEAECSISQHPHGRAKHLSRFCFQTMCQTISNPAERKREHKDSGKLKKYITYQTWGSLDKSGVTSRGISGHWTLIYLPLRQHRCCKAKILTKWPFPILHFLTLQFPGPNGINKAKA